MINTDVEGESSPTSLRGGNRVKKYETDDDEKKRLDL
jgi:hypothetical protein